MFEFLRRSTPRPLSDAIRVAIERDSTAPSAGDPAALRMVQVAGRYSDRKVTYFRVFDPAKARQQAPDVRRYKDFDIFPGLVVRSGHVEHDGTVVLTRPVVVRPLDGAIRTRAGRIVPGWDLEEVAPAPIAATGPTVNDVPTGGASS